MTMLIAIAALLGGTSPPPSAEPMQRCEIRFPAWCLIGSGLYFDVMTVDRRTRFWKLWGPFLEPTVVTITEDSACGSYPSDVQSRSEESGPPGLDGNRKHVIVWRLHKAGSCTLRIEIPTNDKRRFEVVHYTILSSLKACTDDGRCSGPTLEMTPTTPNAVAPNPE
jgi:hypothetical protein